ncbi:MAG: DUF6462 family protein [Chordicoccus sp.]
MTERRAKIEETKNMAKKKYVRYKEGAELYSMGLSKFQQMAHDAKATYKVDKLVLVSIEKFEKYLETFAEDL